VFSSDEAWFSERGEVNSQNNRYQGADNPRFIHEHPLHYEKIDVCCAISARMIIGSVFYDDTVNAFRYVNNIVRQFLAELIEEERLYGVLQQNSAIAHTTHIILEALRDVLSDRIINCGLWPPTFPWFNTL
jgi:hypothetical protein